MDSSKYTLTLPKYIPNKGLSQDEQREKEFGSLESPEFLYVSEHEPNTPYLVEPLEEPSYFTILLTHLNFLILIIVGNFKDFFGTFFDKKQFEDVIEKDGYAPYYSRLESFYVRRMKRKIDDNFSIPTTGVPGRYITCYDRHSDDYNQTLKYTGSVTNCLNFASYNYLGFAQSVGICTDDALVTLRKYGTGAGAPRHQGGTTDKHAELEKLVAKFVGKDDSLIFSQGFSTNANLFDSFLDSECLVISDELNHSSIRTGLRISGVTIKRFPHNNMAKLEKIIRTSISQGLPRTHKPWKKIIVCVEGLYSMEGTMCPLPQLVDLRDKYGFYLFVDEAHSIGAMGPNGRGVCDYFNIDPSRIDILMGTFTKSFGAAGGYVAAEQHIIDRLRLDLTAPVYSESISPVIVSQILTSMKIIMGELNPGEGKERIQRIAFNSRYLRAGLKKLGFIAFGMDDSPVIPLLLYVPNKLPAVARALYKRGIAVVIVGYPATPIDSSRIRICVSAALTKSDLDKVLRELDFIGDKMYFKYARGKHNMEPFTDKPNATLEAFH
ncbi:serine C-palmitoyltransferase [Saccharomycopsis crataegensis]|uniref:serine C-palmitoyltransferase n=1 Tax=Saccharomycopsis crataegensis TaxID=43959 RepID=A0AAV5QR88_9ASCO|nr:serine C-palmitoyltransferase [Saccharomycopsis crataegensis]